MNEFLSKIGFENAKAGVGAYMRYLRDNENVINKSRLYSCSATVIYYSNGDIVLRSYNTDVAVYIHWYNVIAVYDGFSATTSQHIHKFKRFIECNNIAYFYYRSDKCFQDCKGLIYSKYYPKTERIAIEMHYGLDQISKTRNLLNYLCGQKWNN